jgi:hypothetical protein
MKNRAGGTTIRLCLLIVPVLLLIIVFGWELMRARPVYPVTLAPEVRVDIVNKLRQLQPHLQIERDGGGSPILYALSSPGRLPGSVLVNGRMPNSPARIFLYPLRWSDGNASPGLPSKDMGITSGTWDQGLFVKSPYTFYFSSQAGQVQTLNVWNLASGKRQQFVFSTPPRTAKISDRSGYVNDLIVAYTLAGKQPNIILHLAANGVDVSSNELKPNYAGVNNDTLFIRLVEWVRDNIGSAVVAGIENIYYRAIDFWTYHIYHLTHLTQSPVISKPQAQQSVKENGLQWVALVSGPGGKPALESTTLYPDPNRPYAKVSLVRIDPQEVRFHLVAGTKEPVTATGIHGDGEIPVDPDTRMQLIAAFNSGFKTSDGHNGEIIDGITYVHPKTGLATFILYADGHVDLRSWSSEMLTGSPIASLRQNLPLILDNAALNPNIKDQLAWGATVGNAVNVWRSGLGITSGNKIIYAAGNNLSIVTLVRALQAAGCIRAMELDINSYWVSFNLYHWNNSGSYLAGRKLVPEMHRSGTRYLTPDTRDFFYLTLQ